MCGIFGVIGEAMPLEFKACLDTLRHRGPDDEGAYSDSHVSLGFRRLSIIDLSPRGHQPMTNEDESVVIVCNGEIYNYQELRKDLIKKYTFKSETDIEVLIHGYREWGLDGLLSRINGMFAFCLYDKKTKHSYLVRDRIGKKPLYYYPRANGVTFASEVKAFFPLKYFAFQVDLEMFEVFVGFPYLPNNTRTLIAGVDKVPPGHYVECVDGKIVRVVRYWQLPVNQLDISFSDAQIHLEELLTDAVEKRLVADVPVGILLSGGLDSSLITALASRVSKEQVQTITISFPGSGIDERQYAAQVAKHCNTKHLELSLCVDDMYAELEKNIGIYDDLSTVDGGLLSEFLLAQAIRKEGIKVVLVGEGADEIFGGYSWFQFAQYPFKLLPDRLNMMGYHYAVARTLSLRDTYHYARVMQKKTGGTSQDLFHQIQRHEIEYSLPNHYCMKVDKGTSAASVEARAPFMDYRIAEFAAQLPQEYFLKNKWFQPGQSNEKHILRMIAKQYLPPEIAGRKKKGGMLPIAQMLAAGLAKHGDLIEQNVILCNFFGKEYLQRLIRQQSRNVLVQHEREWVLWKCLLFVLWYGYYAKQYENR